MGKQLWVMVEGERQCGACGAWIPPHTWFAEVSDPRRLELLVRCEPCAIAAGAKTPPVEPWPAEAERQPS
jgi:hypothetical protein